MNKRQNSTKQRKQKAIKSKEEIQVKPENSINIISKKLKNQSEIEYLVEKDKQTEWCCAEILDEQLVKEYEEKQKANPMILNRRLIRICDIEVKNENKFLKVQLEGDDQLVEISIQYLKLHAPYQLLQFLLSIYNPYI